MTSALDAAFLRHRRSLLWSVMRIVRDPQTAEDLAQETYIRACRAAEAGPIEHFEAFLHQTARNLALDHLRRRKTRDSVVTAPSSEEALQDVASDTPTAEIQIISRERLEALNRAIALLPERARQVLKLSRIEGWTNTRIAGHLGISERTVFNDLKMALGACHDAIERLDRR